VNQNPIQYRPPEFFAHASAIAFGGQITQVQLRDGGAHADVVPVLPIAGASCALAPGVYQAVSERVDAVTRYRGFEVVRAASLFASAAVEIAERSATTTIEASLGGLSIGFARRRPLRIHVATSRMVTERPRGPGPARFRLAAPELEMEGLHVNFLPADELPPGYEDFRRAPAAFGRDCQHPVNITNGYFGQADEPNPPGVLHLVDSITITDNARIQFIPPNGVYIDDVGQIFFGELTIRENSRAFSLMRMVLGCPVHGRLGGPIIVANGEGTVM
jgi:hypothetical protein